MIAGTAANEAAAGAQLLEQQWVQNYSSRRSGSQNSTAAGKTVEALAVRVKTPAVAVAIAAAEHWHSSYWHSWLVYCPLHWCQCLS